MFLVVGDLDLATTHRLRDGLVHRIRHVVRVHVDLAGHVSGGAADRLDERASRAQEAFLVRIEDRHEGDLGQVEALTQQVDADEHVKRAQAQLAE